MYVPLNRDQVRSAFNDSRRADELYQEIANQFDADEYLIEPELIDIRSAYNRTVKTLRSGVDFEIRNALTDVLEHLSLVLASMRRNNSRRPALQTCYDTISQIQNDVDAVYELNHAWDD